MITIPKKYYCHICNGAREDKQQFTLVCMSGAVDRVRICFSCRDKLLNILCIQCPREVQNAIKLILHFQLNTNENPKDPTRSD